jgi:hypothetical protein
MRTQVALAKKHQRIAGVSAHQFKATAKKSTIIQKNISFVCKRTGLQLKE